MSEQDQSHSGSHTTTTAAGSVNESSCYFDPEFEFRAPKYVDFDELKERIQDNSLNQSRTDEWFDSEEARELEYLDCERYRDDNYREALYLPEEQGLGLGQQHMSYVAPSTQSFLSQCDLSSIVHHVHHHHHHHNNNNSRIGANIAAVDGGGNGGVVPVHQRRRLQEEQQQQQNSALDITVPHSPRFHTTDRARSRKKTLHRVLTTEELQLQAALERKQRERRRQSALRRKYNGSGYTASGRYYKTHNAGSGVTYAVVYDNGGIMEKRPSQKQQQVPPEKFRFISTSIETDQQSQSAPKSADGVRESGDEKIDHDDSFDFNCELEAEKKTIHPTPTRPSSRSSQRTESKAPAVSTNRSDRSGPTYQQHRQKKQADNDSSNDINNPRGRNTRSHHNLDTTVARSPFEKSLLQKIDEFNRHIPSRFKSRPDPVDQQSRQPKLTVPQEFRFHSSNVGKNKTKLLSTEERELLEIQQAPKFRARPVPRAMLHGAGQAGVPKVTKKRCTVPISPNFTTVTRKRSRDEFEQQRQGASNVRYSVRVVELGNKVQPERDASHVIAIKRRTARGDVAPGVRQAGRKAPTIARTPNLATRARSRHRNTNTTVSNTRTGQLSMEATTNSIFRARPMPLAQPFRPKPSGKGLTQPKPFKLRTYDRGAKLQQSMQTKVLKEKQLSKDQRQFRARPLVMSQHPSVPFVRKPKLTDPKPFTLRSESLHENALRQWHAKLEEEDHKRRNARTFIARPMPLAEPFCPKPSQQPLTEFVEFPQYSDVRAINRHEFELRNEQRLLALEQQKQKEAEEEQKRLEQEVAQLRKQMQFQAKPLPQFYRPLIADSDGAKGSRMLHHKRMFKKLENSIRPSEDKENSLQRQHSIREFLQSDARSLLPQQQKLRLSKSTISNIIRSSIHKPAAMRQQQQRHFETPNRRTTPGSKFSDLSFRVV